MNDTMIGSTTRMKAGLAGLLLGAAACCHVASATTSGASEATDVAAVNDLVNKFTQAQVQKDAPALRALTAEQYVEISPLGEVDPREKMLAFYVKDAGYVPPAVALDERTVSLLGDTALIVAKLNFTMSHAGQTRSFAMRSSYVAHKDGGQWKLVSMQATPIRPKP